MLVGPLQSQETRDACILLQGTALQDGSTIVEWTAPGNAMPAVVQMRRHDEVDWRVFDTVIAPPWRVHIKDTSSVEVEVLQQATVNNIPLLRSGYVCINRTLAYLPPANKVLLIISDEGAAQSLRSELDRLTDDAVREGWVVRHATINASSSVREVKRIILNAYADTTVGNLTHVLLIGTVPYATSGGFSVRGAYPNPDFHPEHGGAWASDAYYADVLTSPGISAEYQWTDSSVQITDTSTVKRTANQNVPGDGRFDNSVIPTDLELCVGRIDMADLPSFGTSSTRETEISLIRRYLEKNHQYRSHAIEPPMRALVDDNFGLFSRSSQGIRITEAFATSGWRSFAPVVGADNIVVGDWIPDQHLSRPTLDTFDVLLAYGNGGGGYDHCDFVANTEELAAHRNNAVFTLLFGSYFGDVSSTDNIMRSVLAQQGASLTCGWAGRPHWYLHPLAAGETIGECARLSANNVTRYWGATAMDSATQEFGQFPLGNRGIHVMLLGDPSLRVPGPFMEGTLTIQEQGDSTVINWPAARLPQWLQGHPVQYIVEGSTTADRPYTPLTTTTQTQSTHRLPPPVKHVRVRPFVPAQRLLAPIMGRGLVADRNLPTTSVVIPYPHHSSKVDSFVDVLGRIFHGDYTELPPGLWFLPTGDSTSLSKQPVRTFWK